MKKTLILSATLFSAVAMVQAEDLSLTLPTSDAYFEGNVETLTSGNKLVKWDTDTLGSTLTDFALSFSIGQNTGDSEKTVLSLSSGSSKAQGLCVTIDVNAGQPTVLTLTNGNLGWISNAPTVELTFGETYTLAVLDNKAYLWKGEEIPSTLPATGFDVSDYTSTLSASASRGWSNSAANSITLGKVTDISSLSAVPEPATATLSLLALAGLAARRRRK